MSGPSVADLLRSHGIQPSAQRVAVGEYVLRTEDHPSADRVFARVRGRLPVLSRATVYNTLNLFVREGLLRQLVLAEGKVVFDPKTDRHHHFVDDATGRIHDVPWSAVKVERDPKIPGFDVREFQVVLRGRSRSGRAGSAGCPRRSSVLSDKPFSKPRRRRHRNG